MLVEVQKEVSELCDHVRHCLAGYCTVVAELLLDRYIE